MLAMPAAVLLGDNASNVHFNITHLHWTNCHLQTVVSVDVCGGPCLSCQYRLEQQAAQFILISQSACSVCVVRRHLWITCIVQQVESCRSCPALLAMAPQKHLVHVYWCSHVTPWFCPVAVLDVSSCFDTTSFSLVACAQRRRTNHAGMAGCSNDGHGLPDARTVRSVMTWLV